MTACPKIHIPAFSLVLKCCEGVSLAKCRELLNLNQHQGQFKLNGILLSQAVEDDIMLSSRNSYEFAIASPAVLPDFTPQFQCSTQSSRPSPERAHSDALASFQNDVALTLQSKLRQRHSTTGAHEILTARGLALAGGETAMATAEDFCGPLPLSC
eukprot:TRINITY_DN2534_c0_g1_i1.p1 TRINITY_DN2534_c0_g1~~TRINITY_DN2534_c0_g1_i1.p1  ORF type:complete len:156 (+),score=8.79 TRINITY_DN2534_c0_g1_i1:46-513(+)